MEADLDVLCLITDQAKRRVILEYLGKETRPLLASQVEEAHKDTFNVLDNLSSVETSHYIGDNFLALSWFLGGEDWFTDTELIMKNLAKAGVTQSVAALSVDGKIHNIFKTTGQNNAEIIGDVDEELLEQTGDEEAEEGNIYDFLLKVLPP